MRGTAIHGDTATRNGISYTTPSLSSYCDRFKERGRFIPMLDTHNDSSIRTHPPFGHIENLKMDGNKLLYEGDIDPEEKMFLRKAKRGDLGEVSIQAIVDQIDEQENEETGETVVVANVRELLEISPVTIAGSRDSNMQFLEKIGEKVTKKTLHTLEKKYGLAVTEKRLVEKFRSGIYKEQNDEDSTVLNNGVPEDKDEENPTVKKPNREDVTSSNSDGIVGTKLGKDVKKAPEPELKKQLERANLLKNSTKRINLLR